jgi:hypothetical protein
MNWRNKGKICTASMLLNDKRKHGLETEYITPMQA